MNNEYKYAYAVARVRAAENRLLSRSTIDMLINAADYKKACRILNDNGWSISDEGDGSTAINQRMYDAWDLLYESVPDKKELEIITVENDFHNIKTAVKCIFSGAKPEDVYIRPATIDTQALTEMSKNHDFSSLPVYAAAAAQKAYDIGVETGNGQKIDIVLDIAALNRLYELSALLKCDMLKQICSIKLAATDIKTASRAYMHGKDYDFILNSLCPCNGIDINELAKTAVKGNEEMLSYLSLTKFDTAAKALSQGNTAFEKWIDDSITATVKAAKWKSLGFEPIIAYYYANLMEIKNIRIILASKLNHSDADTLKQRVRELYV